MSSSDAPRTAPRRWTVPTVCAILLIGAALTAGLLPACLRPDANDLPPAGGGGGPTPAPLFQNWPAGKVPDVAFVLSGQQHSYLKFCGCSTPQLGGFERRYNFMAMLKQKGWPLVAADLGDLVKFGPHDIHDQALLKYEIAMRALEILGYSAIGIGEDDFSLPIEGGIGLFTQQKPNAFPRLLAANLDRNYRVGEFPNPDRPTESMIGEWLPVDNKKGPKVGIAEIIGRTVMQPIQRYNAKVQFANGQAVVTRLLKEMDDAKVDLRLMLFQGSFLEAQAIAKDHFPNRFDVIVCLSEEDIASAQPELVGRTMIVRVGQRGRWVVAVGAYRTGKAEKPFDLYYQAVPLGEEYETPKGSEQNHPILKLLDEYAERVKKDDFLKRWPQRAIPNVGAAPVRFIGSQECMKCHAADYQVWKNTKHEHAFDALTKVASKPAQRQFDPECVSCHVTGFGLKGGYDGTIATRQFRNVNCENCHGPGSAHAAAPNNPAFKKAMSPWKASPADLLPTPATLQNGFEAMTPVEKAIYLRVNDMCRKCHDLDNDPHFKFETYWPKIIHGKNAKAPIPAAAKK